MPKQLFIHIEKNGCIIAHQNNNNNNSKKLRDFYVCKHIKILTRKNINLNQIAEEFLK